MKKCVKPGHVRTANGKNCATCVRIGREKFKANKPPGYEHRRYVREKSNPKWVEIRRARWTKHKYGKAIVVSGPCEICGKPAVVVDHDHATGLVRGFLCRICNVWLGVLENRIFVSRAKFYLAMKG